MTAVNSVTDLSRAGEIARALAQFVQQPRVLNGDDRLGGEILHELDLLVGERTDFLAVDAERADEPVFLEHRHHEDGSCAGDIDDRRY